MAEMNLNPRERARLEEEKKNRKIRRKFILIGVLVVLMIALVAFVNSRLFYNVNTALQIGDTGYSVARVNYEYQKAYMTFNQTYGQYFGSMIDTSRSLKDQVCPFDAEGGSWDEYFKTNAEQSLAELTAVYQKAIAEGYILTAEEAAEIDTAIEDYREYGKSLGFPTLNKFLSAYFGTGNSEKTIRENMAQELIASRYVDDMYNSFTYTDAELDDYYTENADSYDRVNVLYTLLSATATEDIDAEEAKTAAEDTAKVILAGAGSTEEDFRTAVLKSTGTEAIDTSYTVSAFLSRFEGSAARDDMEAGSVFSHSTDSGVYVVYVLGTEANDYPTVNVRHILVRAVDADGDGTYSDEEKQTAYDAVKAIEDEWLAGDATEESFATLANEKSEDTGSNTNGGLYERIYKGQMVAEFNDFCFSGHKTGDTAIVYGESGAYAGYHLVYFSGEDALYTRVLAETALRQTDGSEALTALTAELTPVRVSGWRFVMA